MDIRQLKANVSAASAALDEGLKKLPPDMTLDAQRNHVGNISFYDGSGLYVGYVDYFRGEANIMHGED